VGVRTRCAIQIGVESGPCASPCLRMVTRRLLETWQQAEAQQSSPIWEVKTRANGWAVGGQKRVCLVPHGVCEEQGTGEPTVGSQD
jgi:hypothetical protein